MLNNAREACVESGVRAELLIQTSINRGSVQVSVRDNGPGLKEDVVEKVFDPFFSSKPEGMGMGLSISRSIIEAHGGRVWAGNNSDHGATFCFTLPADTGEIA